MSLIGGILGGIVATIVMTAVMKGAGGGPPPSANFYATFLGDGDPEAHAQEGMLLHLLYGTGAGAVYGLLAARGLLYFGGSLSGVVDGLVYGLILMVGAVVWVKGIIGMDPEPKEVGLMTGVHLVYGVVLGVIVAAGVI